jgi:hypothetical protein
MKTFFKLIAVVLVFVSIAIITNSCKKEDPKGTGYMTVKMTDAPGDYLAVNVDVIGVQVHYESTGWITLPVNAGVYDLLELQNNVTTVLASNAQLPIGKISQIRLILGSNNSLITIQPDTFALKVPSGEESGLKINLHETIQPHTTMEIVLDFDAKSSVVVDAGSGNYILKPVIKVKSVTQL